MSGTWMIVWAVGDLVLSLAALTVSLAALRAGGGA